MASTPMDIDAPGSSTPNGNSLQISRAPGGTTSQLSDIISTFRPTKVRTRWSPLSFFFGGAAVF